MKKSTFKTKLKEIKGYGFTLYSVNQDIIKLQCETDSDTYILLDSNIQDRTIYINDIDCIGDVIKENAIFKIIDNFEEYEI